MSSAKIWCEVFCVNCGGLVGYYFNSIDTISRLKVETSDWIVLEDGMQLCPYCASKMREEDDETD